MSKISDKNSNNRKQSFTLRPLGELVTALILKFKRDIFLSTRAKLILFHTFFVLAIIIITITLIEYTQRAVLLAVLESFNSMISTGQVEPDAFSDTNYEILSVQLVVFSVIIVASVTLGLIASRLTLKPVREALEMQRRFIASVAHELRTPLATLKTENEVAMLEVSEGSEIAKTLTFNIEEIDHMTEILNSLLLFNRVDTFESITFESVELTSILKTVIKRLRVFADKKKIELVYKESELLHVHGNATALEQAFFNIIQNAVNYTQVGGSVHIKCVTTTEREVDVEVSDNGIGISKKELRHIFEPFYRTGGGQSTGRGSGLGLAIVFEIVKLHNGRIEVKSTEGIGTRFVFTIPRSHGATLTKTTKNDTGVSYDFNRELSH